MKAVEVNFDGLVGPTHNYAGLARGNLAAEANKDAVSFPRAAALQGLAKMRRLMALGLPQGVLPPHERPYIPVLRRLGFTGGDAQVWARALQESPHLARRAVSASSMWAANAAVVSPSADTADARLHLTPANLHTMAHRALETETTARALRRLFADETHFAVHDALPSHADLADEGAANHMRMGAAAGAPSIEIFAYGRIAGESGAGFPARQTLEASQAIARRHGLARARTLYLRQAREAIAAGAFHNDVVAVAHENVLLFHERAYADRELVLVQIRQAAASAFEPVFIEVREAEVPLTDAIASYLFNAQLLRAPGEDRLRLLLPGEAQRNDAARVWLDKLAASNGPIGAFECIDVRESMRNGGGPACLRLRVMLTDEEQAALMPGFLLDEALAQRLETWIGAHYRERLAPGDLADPALIQESRAALDALTRILSLGGDFYDFQRD